MDFWLHDDSFDGLQDHGSPLDSDMPGARSDVRNVHKALVRFRNDLRDYFTKAQLRGFLYEIDFPNSQVHRLSDHDVAEAISRTPLLRRQRFIWQPGGATSLGAESSEVKTLPPEPEVAPEPETAAEPEPAATPVAENNLAGFRGDLAWVHAREGHRGSPYWPGGASGVTLDPGVDLGHANPDLIESLYAPLLEPEQMAALRTVYGLKGNAAKAALDASPEINAIDGSINQRGSSSSHKGSIRPPK